MYNIGNGVGVSNFAKGSNTPEKDRSHFDGSWDELVNLVELNFGSAIPGDYTPEVGEVIKVPVPSAGFWSPVVEVTPGMNLQASCGFRHGGEERGEAPFISCTASGEKLPAVETFIVLYSAEALGKDRSTEKDWEVIAIQASTMEGGEPMVPTTLVRNFEGAAGGTLADMSDAKKLSLLMHSVKFWSRHAMMLPVPAAVEA